MPRRVDVPTLRAAWWAHRSVRSARRQLRATGLENLELPRVPELPADASRGVFAVLRRLPHTCLERAFVLQRWKAAHGEPIDVVIGVRTLGDEFGAHAWLAGEAPAPEAEGYRELRRVAP
jgi:transglutaminase superfamily protein